ncbi:MAG: acetate kinase, partial [Mailhella sp.]|nr:acetate kinase [Mailhella sp.]
EFGIKIDPELNKIRNSQHRYISTEDSRVKVAVIPTDEELEICRISVEMVENASK